MEEIGNKRKGTVVLSLVLIFTFLTLYGALSLLSGSRFSSRGYKDPSVSTANVRGTIYDRKGNTLAISVKEYGFLVSDCAGLENRIASLISPYTSHSSLEIVSMLGSGTVFFPLSRLYAEEDEVFFPLFLDESGISDHVTFTSVFSRIYPMHTASCILGNAVTPFRAEGGIEEICNSYLAAYPVEGRESVYGSAVVLTLDSEFQLFLEETGIESAYITNRWGEIVALTSPDPALLEELVWSVTSPQGKTDIVNHTPISTEGGVEAGEYSVFAENDDETIVLAGYLTAYLEERGRL